MTRWKLARLLSWNAYRSATSSAAPYAPISCSACATSVSSRSAIDQYMYATITTVIVGSRNSRRRVLSFMGSQLEHGAQLGQRREASSRDAGLARLRLRIRRRDPRRRQTERRGRTDVGLEVVADHPGRLVDEPGPVQRMLKQPGIGFRDPHATGI